MLIRQLAWLTIARNRVLATLFLIAATMAPSVSVAWPTADDQIIDKLVVIRSTLHARNQFAWFTLDIPDSLPSQLRDWPSARVATFADDEHFVEVLDISVEGSTEHWLIRTHFGMRLYSRNQAATEYTQHELPDLIRTHVGRPIIAMQGSNMAIVGQGRIFYKTDVTTSAEAWNVSPLPPERRHFRLSQLGSEPAFAEWHADKLLIGFNAKYWRKGPGNGVFAFSPKEQAFDLVIEQDNQPVNDIRRDRNGTLWLATGTGHMMQKTSKILAGDQFATLASTHNFSITQAFNWDHDAAVFEAVYVDVGNRYLYTLTPEIGILRNRLRRDKNLTRTAISSSWDIVTKDWPGYLFANDFTMLFDGRIAIIASVQHGLVIWDTRRNRYERRVLGNLLNIVPTSGE